MVQCLNSQFQSQKMLLLNQFCRLMSKQSWYIIVLEYSSNSRHNYLLQLLQSNLCLCPPDPRRPSCEQMPLYSPHWLIPLTSEYRLTVHKRAYCFLLWVAIVNRFDCISIKQCDTKCLWLYWQGIEIFSFNSTVKVD